MKDNKYTGEVAYYATMMALTEAMKAANIMLPKPNPLIGKSIEMLQDIAFSCVHENVKLRLSSPAFALLMQNFVAGCGLNTMTVLQLVKKFENECEKNKRSF